MRLGAATMLAASVLLMAAPAGAKPGDPNPGDPNPAATSSAWVSGPGIDVPIVLEGRAALRMAYLTTFRAFGQPEPIPPPDRELGPRYHVWYFVPSADGRLHLIRQDLYPCAATSVWAYTPTEQGPFQRGFLPVPVSTGWWHSTAMLDTVAGWGLPCSDRRATAGAVVDGSGWGGPLAAVAWLALAIALAVVGVARAYRGRALRQPERT